MVRVYSTKFECLSCKCRFATQSWKFNRSMDRKIAICPKCNSQCIKKPDRFQGYNQCVCIGCGSVIMSAWHTTSCYDCLYGKKGGISENN
jgi:hypothetical protein